MSPTATNEAYCPPRINLVRWRRVNRRERTAAVVDTSGGRLGAEPLQVDGVVPAVSLGRGDNAVNGLQQLRVAALLDRVAVLFARVELNTDFKLAGILLDVVGPHGKIVDGRV